MAHLEELNPLLTLATNSLLQNKDICKLLYYYPEKVDFQFNPLTKPDIENPRILLLDKIFPMPKMPDAETEQICFIDVNIGTPRYSSENKGFLRVNLMFDVICHLDSWYIKNGCRPLKVMSEIDKMFNNQLTNLPIIGKPQLEPFEPLQYASKFYGYRLTYLVSVNSNIECKV